jgi:hypothetical protein
VPNDDGTEVEIIRICDEEDDGDAGDGSGGGDGGGSGGGGEITCTQVVWPPELVQDPDGADTFVWWRTEHRDDGGTWAEGYYECSDGTTRTWWSCIAGDCAGEPPVSEPDWEATLDQLVEQASAAVELPEVNIQHSFDQPGPNGDVRWIVQAEAWWWVDAEAWDPVVESDADGPVWVEVTATPDDLTIDPGDGSPIVSCDGPGLAYRQDVSYYDQEGDPRACVHVYRETAEEVTATASMSWTVTYTGATPAGTVSGTLSIQTREQLVSAPVREIHSVISDHSRALEE